MSNDNTSTIYKITGYGYLWQPGKAFVTNSIRHKFKYKTMEEKQQELTKLAHDCIGDLQHPLIDFQVTQITTHNDYSGYPSRVVTTIEEIIIHPFKPETQEIYDDLNQPD